MNVMANGFLGNQFGVHCYDNYALSKSNIFVITFLNIMV